MEVIVPRKGDCYEFKFADSTVLKIAGKQFRSVRQQLSVPHTQRLKLNGKWVELTPSQAGVLHRTLEQMATL